MSSGPRPTPNKWTSAKIKDCLASISAGASLVCDDSPALPGEIGILKTSAVGSGVFNPSENKRLLAGNKHSVKTPVRANTLLICRKNTPELVGGVAYVERAHPNLFLPDLLWELATKPTVDARYFGYVLQSAPVQAAISSAASGSSRSMANISMGDFGEILVPLAPLPEQRRIAEILRTWDEAIKKLEALRASKERRFLALREKLIRHKVPKAKRRSIGSFLTESRIAGSDGATAKKITVKLYGLGAVAKENERGRGSANTKYFRRAAGQLVYSKLDFLNGAFAIIPPSLDGFETTLDLPAFDICDNVNAEWLLQYLVRPGYYSNQSEMARGQRKARRISPTEFLASEILLPPRSDQDKVVEILATAKRDVDATAREIAALQRQKRGLIQKLLTGEWRVNTDGATDA